MNDPSPVQFLEQRIATLSREKAAVLEALDVVAQMGGLALDIKSRQDPTDALISETAAKLDAIIPFQAMAFFLVNEEDGDFRLRFAEPQARGRDMEQELEALISDKVLSWALTKPRPVTVSARDGASRVLLHAISTPSRTRGLFLGLPAIPSPEIPDISFGLLTILLLSCANILEGLELYRWIRSVNQELEHNVTKLAASEKELREQQERLKEQVAERTQDLSMTNERLRREIDERHRAERELRTERDFVSAVLDSSGALVLVLDNNDRIVRFNRACEAVTGFWASEALGKKFTDLLVPPQDLESTLDILAEIRAGAGQATHEGDWLTKDGVTRRITWSHSTLAGEHGKAEFLVAAGIDVTERTRAQEALREAEATYRNLFENAVEGIFQGSPSQGFTKVNPAMARMFGYASSEEFLRESPGMGQQLCVHPEAFADFLQELRVKGSVANHEMLARCRDHRRIWISVSVRSIPGRLDDIEGLVEDVTDRKISQMHLEHRATYDELTDIPNRFLFLARFEQILAQAERMGHGVAVLYIDLDSFKPVNDTHGHHAGDALLKEAAQRLKSRVRRSDILARLGGDEFAALLINVSNMDNVAHVALDIIETLKKPYHVEGVDCVIGASVGASLFPAHGAGVDELLRKADAAMYKVKEGGGNGFCLFDSTCSFSRP